jgi:hypothetical protein
MRDFNLFVPSDCTVSNTKKEKDAALALMKKFLKPILARLPESRCAPHRRRVKNAAVAVDKQTPPL